MSKTKKQKNKLMNDNGYIVILVLVFSGVFAFIMSGLSGFIFVQNKLTTAKENREKAIQIAEAGVDYYKWFLAHNPNNLTDGTGDSGPYEHEYLDPEGGAIGKFSLDISGNFECGDTASVDIVSTGWTYEDPSMTRTIFAKYARPSIAEYAYVTDENIWFGVGENVVGRLHSNGGIRMDGNNDSLVSSEQTTWNCPPHLGCSNPYEEKDGIWGIGTGSALWSFPAEPIDFVGIVSNLVNIKSLAQSSGIYLPKSTDIDPSADGYHIILKNDGTVDVYIIKKLTSYWGWNIDDGWRRNYFNITQETFYNNYTLPSGCSVLFLEDDTWIEGDVSGKLTIVVADLVDSNNDANVVLENDIQYSTYAGTDGLLLFAQGEINIPRHSPNNFILNGLFLSQNGRFGRDYYGGNIRDSLTLVGSVINKKTGTNAWVNGSGTVVSGYRTTTNSFDRKLMILPPPLTPSSDDEYKFVQWQEEE